MVHISERESELPDAVIGKMLRLAHEDKRIISLGAGEPNFNLPKPLIAEARKIAGKCNHYATPQGMKELREAIVKKLSKDNKIITNPENIVVTCGSQEALILAAACTLDVSEQVILPNPSFLGYTSAFELFDAHIVDVKLKEENKFEIDPDDLKKVIDKKKTKVIMLNTPANPTGNVIRRKVLEEVADIARQNNLYIFSDEAYEKIVYDQKHVSIGSLNGMEKNVVTFQSFSKSYAMCGFRLGYAVAHNKLAEAMTKAHVYTTLTAPTISQLLGIKALSLPNYHISRMVNEYRKRRDLIVRRLNSLGLSTVMPEGAFYAFSNISHLNNNSFAFAKNLLEKAKVAAIPGREFGVHGEGYLRFSYAADIESIKKAMDLIEKFLK